MSKYQEYFSVFTEHISNYFFVITSIVGSLIGLRQERGLSFGKLIAIVVTSVTTTVMIALLVDHYYKPGIVVLSILCHFLGLVGNRITIAFIELVDNVIKNPKKTTKEIIEVVQIFLKIRRNG